MMFSKFRLVVMLGMALLAGGSAWAKSGPAGPTGTVDVALRSASGLVQTVGGVFLIDVGLEGSGQVGGADAWLRYDPAYLVVVDTSGNPTTDPNRGLVNGPMPRISATINNTTGLIKYGAGYLDPGQWLGAPFLLFQVRFKTLAATGAGGTALTLDPNRTIVIDAGGGVITGSLINGAVIIEAAATATPTATVSPTATASSTATATPTATVSPMETASSTATATSMGTASSTATAAPTATASSTATATPTMTDTPIAPPTATDTPTATPASSFTPTATGTSTPTPSPLPTVSPTATNTLTAAPTATHTATALPTATLTATATPTAVPSPTATMTASPAATQTPAARPAVSFLPLLVKDRRWLLTRYLPLLVK